ncbi:hypothetical protein Tco_1374595 [Tanacetum coccineum]
MLNPNPDTGIDSILNINTKSTSLVDVPVTMNVEMPPSSATTLPPSPVTLIQPLQQTPVSTPTIIPSTSLQNLPTFGSLFKFEDRVKALEDDFSVFKQTNQFTEAVSSIPSIVDTYLANKMNEAVKTILPKIEKTVNEKLEAEVLTRSSNESKTSHAVAANLYELELKKILIDKMENIVSFKRHRDDVDKDKEPSAGSNRGSKRRRAGKEPESTKEPIHTVDDLEEPAHQEFDTGFTEDQPVDDTTQLPDWFQKPAKPPTPDRDWNKTLPAAHGPIQPWISTLARNEDPRESFDELMDTPLDFSAFVLNRLKVDTLTSELLADPTFELMKGSCKSLVELEYFLEEGRKHQQFYGFAVNRESARDVYSRCRIIAITKVKIVEWHNYKHLDWITVRRNDDKLYTHSKKAITTGFAFKTSKTCCFFLRRVKDLQLGIESYQKKLNLTKPDTYRLDLKQKTPYTAYSNPKGFIYQNKDKKNILMCIDELHKFSDGTLNDFRSALDDILKRIRMEYLPQIV